MPVIGTPITPSTVVGTYSSVTLGKRMFGVANVISYSDIENTGSEDTDNEQQWLDYATDWIELAFSRVGRPIPILNTEKDFTSIQLAATEWWVPMMAKGRGDLPEGVSNADGFDSMMDGHIERAEKALADLLRLWNENNSTSGAVSSASAVTVSVGGPKIYPGTGGTILPSFNVPTLGGNASW